jgi:dienelactone hydrolase
VLDDVAPSPLTRSEVKYAVRDGRGLHADVYEPERVSGCVLLLHGEPALEEGGRFWSEDRCVKDSGPLTSWAETLSQHGLKVVVPNVRSSAGFRRPDEVDADVDLVVGSLMQSAVPKAVLAFSGGTPFALALARRRSDFRRVVTMYGALDLGEPALATWFPGGAHPVAQRWNPIGAEVAPYAHMHVWPEQDWLPNNAIRYQDHARARGFDFVLKRHPTGGHGFDFVDDDETSRQLIREVVSFLVGIKREGE